MLGKEAGDIVGDVGETTKHAREMTGYNWPIFLMLP
jgi:hypothetical protein